MVLPRQGLAHVAEVDAVLRAVHGDRVEDALRLAHGEWPLPRRAEELPELRRADVRRVLLLYLGAQGLKTKWTRTIKWCFLYARTIKWCFI